MTTHERNRERGIQEVCGSGECTISQALAALLAQASSAPLVLVRPLRSSKRLCTAQVCSMFVPGIFQESTTRGSRFANICTLTWSPSPNTLVRHYGCFCPDIAFTLDAS